MKLAGRYTQSEVWLPVVDQDSKAWPVYPGHPLVLAVLIMRIFPNLQAAGSRSESGYPAALVDSDIPGAGCHVYAALRILQTRGDGVTPQRMIEQASEYWTRGKAGGHLKNVAEGIAHAEQFVGEFLTRATDEWFTGDSTT